jgi:5-methyltetrahydrofolate--homocysteine methyltransferase
MTLLELVRTRVLVGDGAMGTQLQAAGLPLGQGGESWNLDHPDRVEAIHRSYLAAGSDLVLTNSFGAHRWALERRKLGSRAADINFEAASIARRAAGPDRIVLGDVGPSGQILEPLGPLPLAELRSAIREQVGALLAGGADGIIIETMSAIEEAEAAVGSALAAGAPAVIASMTFDRLPDGRMRTVMGVAPSEAARRLAAAGAAMVGANCGTRLTLADYAALTQQLTGSAIVPIVIQPNAGQPRLDAGRVMYDMLPDLFAEAMAPVLDAGARIVGGCCGTTPDHIRALRRLVDARGPSRFA